MKIVVLLSKSFFRFSKKKFVLLNVVNISKQYVEQFSRKCLDVKIHQVRIP